MTLWNNQENKYRIIKINIIQFRQKILNCPIRLHHHLNTLQVRVPTDCLSYTTLLINAGFIILENTLKKILQNVNFYFIL